MNPLRIAAPALARTLGLRLDAEVDARFRHGHGTGYVSAYTHRKRWRGRELSGTGYLEWVDRRQG